MKVQIATVGLMVALAHAQDLPTLSDCGKVCFNNLISQFTTLGCKSDNDYTCLCTKSDFFYGIRDCSQESCTSSEEINGNVAYSEAFCEKYGVVVTNVPTDTTGTSSVEITVTSQSSTETTSAQTTTTNVKVTASFPFSTTIVSGTSTSVSTGWTTLVGSTGIVTSVTPSKTGSATTQSGTSKSPSDTSNVSTASTTTTDGSSASTTSSEDLAPRQTAGIVGIVAAVGAAALLL